MKTILSIIFLSLSLPLFSQDVTYNHDRVKQNQFTAMEAGYGSLDDWYYIVFHNSYKSDAHETNKGAQRLATDLATIPQVEYADSIQEALKERAKEEAKIIIDNTVDAAAFFEKSKLTDLLMNFQNNYSRITMYGGKRELQNYYEEYYKMYNFALDRIGSGIMPNSVRERQYIALYNDICEKNKEAADYVIALYFSHRLRQGSGTTLRLADPSLIASTRFINWRTRAWATVPQRNNPPQEGENNR